MSEGFPEVPFSQELHMMLQTIDALGTTERLDDYRPNEKQFALKAGDYAIVAATSSGIDAEISIGQIVDAEGLVPDWEERLFKSYLPMKWYAKDDITGEIGWFSRVKLIPITEEQFKEVYGWITESGFPDDYPEWLIRIYEDFTDALHQQQPENIPKRAICRLCGSKDTEIHAVHTTRIAVKAGEVDFKGEPRYVGISHPQGKCETEAHIHCRGCNGRGELNDAEYHLDWPHQ
jgi:hypothetical protein